MKPGRVRRLVPALTALAVLAQAARGAPGSAPPAAPAGRLVYLDFTDGSEAVTRGERDDASRNVSRLCEARALARWEPSARCGPRDHCREEVLARVRAYFEPYEVRFTLTRPLPDEVYTTIMVAPPVKGCTFGRRGVALTDCGDANPRSLGFAFDCYRDAASCAVLVAHETAHTFGLVHSLDPGDVMTPGPEDPALRFSAAATPTEENQCGVTTQSSHAALLAALGARQRLP